jgi:hypothetical protein
MHRCHQAPTSMSSGRKAAQRRSEIVHHVARSDGRRRAAVVARAPSATDGDAKHQRALSAQGRLGRVQFILQRVEGGLYVEREVIPNRGRRTIESMAFIDANGFEQWCDDDPVRFEHPLLHTRLKSEAGQLWQELCRTRLSVTSHRWPSGSGRPIIWTGSARCRSASPKPAIVRPCSPCCAKA